MQPDDHEVDVAAPHLRAASRTRRGRAGEAVGPQSARGHRAAHPGDGPRVPGVEHGDVVGNLGLDGEGEGA